MSNADAVLVIALMVALLLSQAWGWYCWHRWGRAIDKWRDAVERNREYIALVQTEREARREHNHE